MVGPMTSFAYVARLSKNEDGGYTITANNPGTVIISDRSDGPMDDLTVLGDISPDNFNTTIEGATFTQLYIGATSSGEIISEYDGNYFLQTNTDYAVGSKINNQQVEYTIACYKTGTLIRTARGDFAVEALEVGDLAVTSSGEHRAIRWLGSRTIDCRRYSQPGAIMPICIAAHAFGDNRPVRDLYLSPGHPVLIGADDDVAGGHLVPIMCLINGTTVRRVAVDKVTYWHIELEQHDILLAEGLPAESYIDLGSRPWFNGADGTLYDPDMGAPGMTGRCRPVAIDGPVVEAERSRLDAVFAMRLAAASAWPTADDQPLLTA